LERLKGRRGKNHQCGGAGSERTGDENFHQKERKEVASPLAISHGEKEGGDKTARKVFRDKEDLVGSAL